MPVPLRPRPLAGLVAGLLAGLAGGLVGGAFAGSIEAMRAPTVDEALFGALRMGPIGMAAGGAAGLLLGMLVGRVRSRWRTVLLTSTVIFWATLVGTIQAAQWDAGSAALAFMLGVVLFTGLGLILVPVVMWLWKWRLFVAVILGVCVAGEVMTYFKLFRPIDSEKKPVDKVTQGCVVTLCASPLPDELGVIAEHHWFMVQESTTNPSHVVWWEVMEQKNLGGTSWGHVYKDLFYPHTQFGYWQARLIASWKGSQADALAEVLARSPEYPYRDRYLAWPGPNSNTYVAWVLREAGVGCDLGPKALGQNYLGVAGVGLTPGGTGVMAETNSLGVKVGWREGAEVHLLGFVFGLDVWTPGLKTPLGRFGYPE